MPGSVKIMTKWRSSSLGLSEYTILEVYLYNIDLFVHLMAPKCTLRP